MPRVGYDATTVPLNDRITTVCRSGINPTAKPIEDLRQHRQRLPSVVPAEYGKPSPADLDRREVDVRPAPNDCRALERHSSRVPIVPRKGADHQFASDLGTTSYVMGRK
jgi:hypothetical protein